jgi:hypothetical protein
MTARTPAAALLTIALCGAGFPRPTSAQEPARPPATAPEKPGPWVGIDVFAGGSAFQRYEQPDPADEEADVRYAATGWHAGATLFVGVPWLGITGSAGCQTIETVPACQVAVGPQAVSPWIVGETMGFRVFAHALYGFASTRGDAPPQTSAEWVFGGGIDFLLMRVQVDYVRLNLDPLKRGNSRIFIGGVVPLCLRSCRDGEINLSGHPATR